MKKIFTLLVLLAILPLGLRGQDGVSVWDGTIATEFAGGNGTKDNPYQISNGAQLAYLAQQVNGGETYSGKYFILTNDIVLNEEVLDDNGELKNSGSGLKEWTPIGTYDYNKRFKGKFDGKNHTVKGLYINDDNATYQALFGVIEYAEIKNIKLEDCYIKATYMTGGLVAYSYESNILNVSFAGNIILLSKYLGINGDSKKKSYIGGIVAFCNATTISGCSNIGKIELSLGEWNEYDFYCYIGGLVGFFYNSEINCCYNNGDILFNPDTFNDFYVGGIIGAVSYGEINNCYCVNEIKQNGYSLGAVIGGLIGSSEHDSSVNDCYAISSAEKLYGLKYSTEVINSYYAKNGESDALIPFENGEIAYKLQRDQASEVWGQDIDAASDKYPQFNSEKVYNFRINYNEPEGIEKTCQNEYFNDSYSVDVDNLETELPTCEGYKFKGWYDNAEGEGVAIESDFNITAESKEIFAKWERITYNVTFKSNGGEGTMVSQQFFHGVAQQLKENEFTKEGYTLTSWNTSDDGQGDTYDIGVDIRVTSDLILYAQWKANTYEVKFDANGGSGDNMANQSFTYDDAEKALYENTYTRVGYEFVGWNTSADRTGTPYNNKANVSNLTTENNGIITLYAQWEANTYTVKFDANGGEGTMDIMQLTYDKSQALTKNKYTKAGYTFVGWSAEQDGEVKYSDEKIVKNLVVSGEIVLYAKWEAIPVVITYHDLHITESVGAKLVSRNGKDRTPDGGSFTLSLEKEEGYEDCEPTVYYKRGRFDDWKELKLDEVSGYYQIRSVYTDIYVKVSGDGIWPVSNEEVEAQEVKVYTQNGAIVVSTPSMMEVQIISMTGSVVASEKVAGQREFRNLAEGVYIVRVGREIVKVRM